MKKFLKIILIIITILVIALLINFIRNYTILNSLFNHNVDFSTYSFEEIIDSNNTTYTNCIYSQNNIYYIKIFENNEHLYNIWIDNNTKEYIKQDVKTNHLINEDFNTTFINKYKNILLNSHDFSISSLIIDNYIFKPITEYENQYILSVYNNTATIFVNKDTKLIDKVISKDNEVKYIFTDNISSDIKINMPEI